MVRCWLSCPPVVLRLACAPSCFVGPFCICGVATCFFLALFLLACVCSVELSVCCVGCAWGVLFLLRNCLCLKRVSYHRRLPQHLAQLMHVSGVRSVCLVYVLVLFVACFCVLCFVLAYLCTACNARARSCGPFVHTPYSSVLRL